MTVLNVPAPDNSFLAYLGFGVIRRQGIAAEVVEGLEHEEKIDLLNRILQSVVNGVAQDGLKGGVFLRPWRPDAPYEVIVMNETVPRDLFEYLTDLPRQIEPMKEPS